MRIVIAPDKFKGSLPATQVAAAVAAGLRAALEAGARRIVLGVGGSASTDGGAGLLQALGARVLDARGRDRRGLPAERPGARPGAEPRRGGPAAPPGGPDDRM